MSRVRIPMESGVDSLNVATAAAIAFYEARRDSVTPMSGTYANVDASTDVAAALAWQDRVDAWPQIAAYKRRSYELLRVDAADPVLDVGSGTGHDLLALDAGAIGIDASTRDVHRRPRAGRPSAGRLPVRCRSRTRRSPACAPIACSSTSTIPTRALAEMVRVTRPGGRVVVADPDQGSLVISVPGVRPELIAAVRRMRRDVGYRNGTLARDLPRRCAEHGSARHRASRRSRSCSPIPTTRSASRRGSRIGANEFTEADAAEWDAGMQRAREQGNFVYALLYFVVSGTRA